MKEKYTNKILIDEQFQGPNLVFFLKESAKPNLYFPNNLTSSKLLNNKLYSNWSFNI
jgi:hypothetical protein